MTAPATSTAPAVRDFTFSFNCVGDVSLTDRFAAARSAGFAEVGLSVRWTRLWLEEGHSLDELADLVEASGLRIGELEAIRLMQAEPDPLEDLAASLAERLRPRRVQAIGSYDGTLDDAVRRASRFADRFAAWDVDVVLEPLPFTNVQTPADAAEIIRRADRPNLSMCMDVWHLYRMGLPLSHLDGLWPVISTVQVNDGTVECQHPEDLREDCLLNRQIPGEGEFDLVGLIRARNENRPDSTFSVEVINPALRAQDAALSARQIADGLAGVLAASRAS